MSGVGKTTIINELSKTSLFLYPKMYTTRPVRERIKDGKIHVTEEDYKNIPSKVVEFCYNQYKYAITDKEVQRANIFDLAPSGFRSLQENYTGSKRIVLIYIWIDERERINRMKKREENEQNILSRLAKYSIFFRELSLGKTLLVLVTFRYWRFSPSIIFVVYMIRRTSSGNWKKALTSFQLLTA